MKLKSTLLSALSSFALVSTPMAFAGIGQGIEKILHKSKKPIQVGIVVRQAKTGKILYSKHRNYLYAPRKCTETLNGNSSVKLPWPEL